MLNGLDWPDLDHMAILDHITVARLDLHAHAYSSEWGLGDQAQALGVGLKERTAVDSDEDTLRGLVRHS